MIYYALGLNAISAILQLILAEKWFTSQKATENMLWICVFLAFKLLAKWPVSRS